MSLELEKSMRIINDIVSYCYYEGAEAFDIRLCHGKGEATGMEVSCLLPGLESEQVDEIRRVLQVPRQHEVEQDYWELTGETEFGGELSLAGVMSDRAEVRYENGRLVIAVFRDN